MTNRVKFYSRTDLCYGMHLDKIESLIIPEPDSMNINDAIEFYEFERYFNDGVRLNTWDDASCQEYIEKSKQLSALCKRFFNTLNDNNIVDVYNGIELGYHSIFWLLFDNCKLYNRISNETFAVLINCDRVFPKDLFLHKKIVEKYGAVLRKYILDNEHCINVLLHVYEQDHTDCEKLTLPSELTGEEICVFLEKYIDGEHPNTNRLQTIVYMHPNKQFPISDEIRLKAKRRYEAELEDISQKNAAISKEITIAFDGKQEKFKDYKRDGTNVHISYSTKWLLETLDYPSILNNFIYVFAFVDYRQMRCSHVNHISESGVLERAFASKSSLVYPHNYAFDYKNTVAGMEIYAYYEFLLKNNIRLENVLRWFFTEYIQSEFGCPEVRLSMPSTNCTYAEKCTNIISAFDSVLKQYYYYAKNGEIDFELIGMSTTPLSFANIKSLVKDKYVYGTGEDYQMLSFWLFSDQCTFSFVKRLYDEGKHYDCLCDLLLKEDVFISDYRSHEHGAFETMANHDIIAIKDDGKIVLKNIVKVAILRDLFQNEVISRWHYPPDADSAFSDFIEKGLLTTESTLFSQPETHYLNYLLNRTDYCNSLEIRNKYMHGIQHVNQNETEHKQNYFVLLRLFVLLAIKINDEFWLNDLKKKDTISTDS